VDVAGQVDANQPPGATSAEQQGIKELEREIRDLKETNEMLRASEADVRRNHRIATNCRKVRGRA
jgi:transposase-like protein